MKEIHKLVLGAEVTVHIQYVAEKMNDEFAKTINKIANGEDVDIEIDYDSGYVSITSDDPGKVPEILKIFGGW